MRYAFVAGLALIVLAEGAPAQQPYCPIVITSGDLWLDTFPLSIKNVGNGLARGVQIISQTVIMNPAGGAVVAPQLITTIPELRPGEETSIKLGQFYYKGNIEGRPQACVPY